MTDKYVTRKGMEIALASGARVRGYRMDDGVTGWELTHEGKKTLIMLSDEAVMAMFQIVEAFLHPTEAA